MKMEEDVSADEMPLFDARVLPFRSNILEISWFAFSEIDETYLDRAMKFKGTGSCVVGNPRHSREGRFAVVLIKSE